jgi:hypothetical protein
MPCNPVEVHRHFEGTDCLHLQVRRVSHATSSGLLSEKLNRVQDLESVFKYMVEWPVNGTDTAVLRDIICIKLIYRMSQEERSILWEVTVSVILSRSCICTCPIPNCFRDRAISLYSSKIVGKKEILRIYCSSDKVGTKSHTVSSPRR